LSIKSRKGGDSGNNEVPFKIVGRGRREPVGGEDGVKVC